MYFSNLAAALLLSAPAVSAQGNLGFSIGVKRNSDGQCKEATDYENDFDQLQQYTNTVRVYASSDCNTLQNIGPALDSKNFNLYLGVWPTDEAHFQAEQQALRQYLPNVSKDRISGVTVGSEAIYRDDMSADELADAINTVKSLLSEVTDKDGNSYSSTPVGTVDSWNIWVDGGNAAAIKASDFVFANAFSYWQGQTMNNASYSFSDDIMQALQQIESIKGTDIDFWVGETGWPTEGENFESSEPSVENT